MLALLVMAAGGQAFRLGGAGQRLRRQAVPAVLGQLIGMQLAGVGVQCQQATGNHRQPGDHLLQLAKGRDHVHRLAALFRLRVGTVGPDADTFLADIQQVLLVIHRAVFAFRRQAQGAHMGGVVQQAIRAGDQPLVAHAFLTDDEQVQVGRLVLIQTQVLDAVVAGGQYQLLVHPQVGRIGH